MNTPKHDSPSPLARDHIPSVLDRRASLRTSALTLLFLASLDFAPELNGQTVVSSATATGPAVRLTILGDNAVARLGVKAVWGFACLVEARGHTVLFDTGGDPALLKDNLAVLKVAPARIEAVVISHYHADHTGGTPGLGTLPGVRVFTPRSFEEHPKETATLQSAGLTLVPSSETTPLFEGITISEPLHFEGRIPFGGPGQGFTDEVWEQCLTVDTPDGLVVIAGCSHPGILATLDQVKRQTGRPLHLVIGGFHLLGQPDAEVRQIATTMQAMGVAHVSATHCTGEAAAHVFRDVFGDRYVTVGVGTTIDLPLAATAKPSAQQPNAPLKPSLEHQKLALWFGDWTYEGEYQTTPLGPGGKFTGRMTGHPILDGFGGEYVFLENGPSGETRTVETDGYDPVAKNYPNICVGSDGSLAYIPYTMNGNVASWEGTSVIGGRQVGDPGTDAVASDGMSFTRSEEICIDGKTWVPFVTMKATKAKAVSAKARNRN
jgi:7,8-dihydropterin-6-yl-methyl-4-(beta-D-ribofuranosyl)aminobenzene 5'-phosphate synthase